MACDSRHPLGSITLQGDTWRHQTAGRSLKCIPGAEAAQFFGERQVGVKRKTRCVVFFCRVEGELKPGCKTSSEDGIRVPGHIKMTPVKVG